MNLRTASLALIPVAVACSAPKPATESPESEPAATPVALDDAPAEGGPAAADPAEPTEGEPTDSAGGVDFSLSALDGNTVTLSEHRGKIVVLEWFNPGCPFVKYAHSKGPLTEQPQRVMSEGHVWLAVNSGAPGKQGHGVEVNEKAVADWNMSYPLLVDEDGTVGQMLGAVTTPHMFVIDPEGTVVYSGALDSAPLGKGDGDYVNYVDAALADLAAGRPVATAETKSYGCSVKY